MKKLIYVILILILMILLMVQEVKAEVNEVSSLKNFTISEAYIPSENNSTTTLYIISTTSIFIDTYDLNTLKQLIKACEKQKADICSKYPFSCLHEDNELPKEVLTILEEIDKCKEKYQSRVNEIYYQRKIDEYRQEYPTATECWLLMKEQGWSDSVCAGILGNMMAECGGQTLNLNGAIGSEEYYGLCQWALEFAPDINGASIQDQMEYLFNDIEKQFNCYGKNFQEFLQMQDVQLIALEFAEVYERCESESYSVRMLNAIEAYNYFI